jgi:predicted ArsR family transcriptional regulator
MSDPVDAIGALHDPVRRAVYHHVIDQPDPVGRNEVAQALGIGRTLAAFHLDKLAAAGLLDVSYARRSGRSGPGAGRPAKLYRRADAEHAVSLPPRTYLAAARLLAAAVEKTGADGALHAAARQHGESVGAERIDAERKGTPNAAALLAGLGYEPESDGTVTRLRNCPFHALASEYPPLICGMNLALVEGLLAGAGLADCTARLDPRPDGCCVAIDSKNNNC